jgi:multiple antibiotic resistance protein
MLTFLQVFFAVFGVMDPVGNVPVFLSLTRTMTEEHKRKVALKAVLRAGTTLVVFVFTGSLILNLFQVSLESFRIAGGIIMVIIGLQILFGINIRKDPDESPDDISIVPLATPLIAGPGMIATAVVLAKEYGYLVTLVCLGVNLLLELILFFRAGLILKMLGKEGTLVFAKIMGLILVTIGIEFIRTSIT